MDRCLSFVYCYSPNSAIPFRRRLNRTDFQMHWMRSPELDYDANGRGGSPARFDYKCRGKQKFVHLHRQQQLFLHLDPDDMQLQLNICVERSASYLKWKELVKNNELVGRLRKKNLLGCKKPENISMTSYLMKIMFRSSSEKLLSIQIPNFCCKKTFWDDEEYYLMHEPGI